MPKTPGLFFRVVPHYFAGDVKYFITAQTTQSGISNNFTSIRSATNGSAPSVDYSVEWTGYFIPTQSGIWEFNTTSDDASYLWVGDNAINDYSAKNSLVNNKNLHGMVQINSSANFIQNKLYPIRIQFGQNYGGYEFVLSVTAPDRTKVNVNNGNIFFTFNNSTGTFNEKELLYYSLVEQSTVNSDKGMFQCYVSKPDIQTYNQIRLQTNQYNYSNVWSAFDEKKEYTMLRAGNYLTLDNLNNLSIFDVNGNLAKTLAANANGLIELNNDGNLYVQGTDGNWTNVTNITKPANNVSNVQWSKIPFPSNKSNTLILPINGRIACDNRNILVSNDSKYKLGFTEQCNLVIKTSIESCTGRFKDVKYSKLTDNLRGSSFYPYRINADEVMNEIYLETDKQNGDISLMHVPKTDSSVELSNTYDLYEGKYPSILDIPNSVTNPTKSCDQLCRDANCKHYYDFSIKNEHHCLINSDTDLPRQIIPQQPNSVITKSNLYVNKYKLDFDKSDVRSQLGINTSNNYGPEHNANMSIAPIEFSKSVKTSGIDPILSAKIHLNNQFLGKEEGFDNHGYTPSAAVYSKYASNPTTSMPTAITDNQITPLSKIADDYAGALSHIDSNQALLKQKIANYNGLHANLAKEKDNKYDYDGSSINYKKPPTINDALIEDANVMILQQNDIFALGSIAVATVLIAAIYIGRE